MSADKRRRRLLSGLAGLTLCLSGCDATTDQSADSASGSDAPSAAAICDQAEAFWDRSTETCSLVLANAKQAPTTITATYPVALAEDPTAGPVLSHFLGEFFDRHRRSPDDNATEDSVVTLTYTMFEHGPATKSVLFRDYSFFAGAAHPNTTLTSFTFDLERDTAVALEDLLCDGLNPDAVLPPLLHPYVVQEIDRLRSTLPAGATAPEPGEFEPVPPGAPPHHTFVTGYHVWVLDGDYLKFFLPSERTGPVGAGLLTPRVPLADLKTVRAGNCAA